jgi:hypothetical protein
MITGGSASWDVSGPFLAGTCMQADNVPVVPIWEQLDRSCLPVFISENLIIYTPSELTRRQ